MLPTEQAHSFPLKYAPLLAILSWGDGTRCEVSLEQDSSKNTAQAQAQAHSKAAWSELKLVVVVVTKVQKKKFS